jgi:hypothetical protein
MPVQAGMGDEPLGREAVLPPERQTSVKIARPIREKMVNGEKARKIGVQGKKKPGRRPGPESEGRVQTGLLDTGRKDVP